MTTVTEKVAEFAAHHPQVGLTILRYTLGACCREHLCQASCLHNELQKTLNTANDLLKRALAGILDADIHQRAWIQATLPQKEGGLGLRDPTQYAVIICGI